MNAKSDPTLFCSFCGKSQHMVKKLVAGPGIFICDACVALCFRVITDSPEPDPLTKIDFPGEMPTDQLLSYLGAADSLLQRMRDKVQETVDVLRKREVSWADIGGALKVSRQAAWERFS